MMCVMDVTQCLSSVQEMTQQGLYTEDNRNNADVNGQGLYTEKKKKKQKITPVPLSLDYINVCDTVYSTVHFHEKCIYSI